MNTPKILTAAALAAVLSLAAQYALAEHHEAGHDHDAMAAPAPGKEKCYGVVRTGKNDCSTDAHGCAGYALKDNDPAEWVNVPAGLCDKLAGGTLAAPAPAEEKKK